MSTSADPAQRPARTRQWYEPLRTGGASVARRWRRSLQFRTVVATILLTSVAFAVVGGFLSNRVASALYVERFGQFQEESTNALADVKTVFSETPATDRETTDRLALDTLTGLTGTGADAPRQWLLTPLPGQQGYFVPPRASVEGAAASALIPQEMTDAIIAGDDQYWAPIEIPVSQQSGRRNAPGVAFGTKVTLPPDRTEYALYIYYDLSSMQGTLDDIHRVLWAAGTVLLGIVGAVAWFVTRSVVRPVSHAAFVSEKLAAGHLQERMDVRGEDEVARLGASFNRMAANLQDQITQLAQLSQMQQRFVSDVSHELRTPLTTVRMAAEVLFDARREFDPVNKRSAEILFDQVERFQSLLADLLEISRFDAGAAVLEPEPADIFQIVRHVIAGTEPLADASGSVVTIVSAETSCVVEVDSRRIDRILRNLLVNALEHGEGEPIDIHIASGPDAVAVAVRDHGIGMTPTEASRVFDRFWRADPARARTTGGSGLGLSIAVEDARLHGAWLQAWGAPGDGSCFRLTLPRRQGSEVNVSPLPLPPRGGIPPGEVPSAEVHPGGTLPGGAPSGEKPSNAPIEVPAGRSVPEEDTHEHS